MDATEESVSVFLAHSHGDPYTFTEAGCPDLWHLAGFLDAAALRADLDAFMRDPAHVHGVLIPTLQYQLSRNEPTADLEQQLSDRLEDYLADPNLLALPLELLRRVLAPRLAVLGPLSLPAPSALPAPPAGPLPADIFAFLMRLLDATDDRASVLFEQVPINSLTGAQLAALHDDRPRFRWAFFAKQMSDHLFDWLQRQAALGLRYDALLQEFAALRGVVADMRAEITAFKAQTNAAAADLRAEFAQFQTAQRKEASDFRDEMRAAFAAFKTSTQATVDALTADVGAFKAKMEADFAAFKRATNADVDSRVKTLETSSSEVAHALDFAGTPIVGHRLETARLYHAPFDGVIAGLLRRFGRDARTHKQFTVDTDDPSAGQSPWNAVDFASDSMFSTAGTRLPAHLLYDFGKRRVRLTGYSVRSARWHEGGHHLKTWKVEGSNDGTSWKLLHNEANNGQLNGQHAVGTWQIDPTDAFRKIRLQMTADTWKPSKWLTLEAWELYGFLIEDAA